MTGPQVTVQWEGPGQARIQLPDGDWCTVTCSDGMWSATDSGLLRGWEFADVDGLVAYVRQCMP